MIFNNQKEYQGQQINNVVDRPVLHKKGKQWIVIGMSTLALAGLGYSNLNSANASAKVIHHHATHKIAHHKQHKINTKNINKYAHKLHKKAVKRTHKYQRRNSKPIKKTNKHQYNAFKKHTNKRQPIKHNHRRPLIKLGSTRKLPSNNLSNTQKVDKIHFINKSTGTMIGNPKGLRVATVNGQPYAVNANQVPKGYKLANDGTQSFKLDGRNHIVDIVPTSIPNNPANVPVNSKKVRFTGELDLKFNNGNQVVKDIKLPYNITTKNNEVIHDILNSTNPSATVPADYLNKVIDNYSTSNFKYDNNADSKEYDNVVVDPHAQGWTNQSSNQPVFHNHTITLNFNQVNDTDTINFVENGKVIKTEKKTGKQGTSFNTNNDVPAHDKIDGNSQFTYDGKTHIVNVSPIQDTMDIQYIDSKSGQSVGNKSITGNDASPFKISDYTNTQSLPAYYQLDTSKYPNGIISGNTNQFSNGNTIKIAVNKIQKTDTIEFMYGTQLVKQEQKKGNIGEYFDVSGDVPSQFNEHSNTKFMYDGELHYVQVGINAFPNTPQSSASSTNSCACKPTVINNSTTNNSDTGNTTNNTYNSNNDNNTTNNTYNNNTYNSNNDGNTTNNYNYSNNNNNDGNTTNNTYINNNYYYNNGSSTSTSTTTNSSHGGSTNTSTANNSTSNNNSKTNSTNSSTNTATQSNTSTATNTSNNSSSISNNSNNSTTNRNTSNASTANNSSNNSTNTSDNTSNATDNSSNTNNQSTASSASQASNIPNFTPQSNANNSGTNQSSNYIPQSNPSSQSAIPVPMPSSQSNTSNQSNSMSYTNVSKASSSVQSNTAKIASSSNQSSSKASNNNKNSSAKSTSNDSKASSSKATSNQAKGNNDKSSKSNNNKSKATNKQKSRNKSSKNGMPKVAKHTNKGNHGTKKHNHKSTKNSTKKNQKSGSKINKSDFVASPNSVSVNHHKGTQSLRHHKANKSDFVANTNSVKVNKGKHGNAKGKKNSKAGKGLNPAISSKHRTTPHIPSFLPQVKRAMSTAHKGNVAHASIVSPKHSNTNNGNRSSKVNHKAARDNYYGIPNSNTASNNDMTAQATKSGSANSLSNNQAMPSSNTSQSDSASANNNSVNPSETNTTQSYPYQTPFEHGVYDGMQNSQQPSPQGNYSNNPVGYDLGRNATSQLKQRHPELINKLPQTSEKSNQSIKYIIYLLIVLGIISFASAKVLEHRDKKTA